MKRQFPSAIIFLFWLTLSGVFSNALAQNIETVFMREVLRSEENIYTGRFEVSAENAPKIYELYRFTYQKSDRARQYPLSIAFLYLGKPSDAYNALKTAEIKFQYNAARQLIEKRMLNASARPDEVRRYKYQGKKLSEERIYNRKDKLSEKITYSYDLKGNLVKRAFKNAKGRLSNNRLGYAIRKYTYNKNNRVIKEEVLTEKRRSIRKLEFDYDKNGRVRQKIIRDETGRIKEILVFEYNRDGLLEEKKVLNQFKYPKQRTRYQYDGAERVIQERTLDGNGQLMGDMFDIAIIKTKYRSNGVREEELRHNSQNRPKNKVVYNEFEMSIERTEYTEQGWPGLIIRRKYDNYGNLLRESNYKIKSSSRREVLSEALIYEKARLREKLYYNAAGRLQAKELRNENGRTIEEIYYDANGNVKRRKKR